MTRSPSFLVMSVVGWAALAAGFSQPLRAQAPEPEATRRHQASFNSSVFGGYDTDISAGGVTDPRLDADGSHVGTALSLKYQAKHRRIDVSSQADSDLRWYRTAQTLTAGSFFGSGTVSSELTRQLRVSGSMQTNYLPQFQFTLAPSSPGTTSEIVPPSLDRSVSRGESLSVSADAGLTYELNSRSEIQLNYGAGRYTLLDDDYEMTTQSFAGAVSRKMTRYATLRLGYGEQHVAYPGAAGVPAHSIRNRLIDAGVNYSRPLSATRRTTIGFGSGTAAVENGPDRFFTMTGHASVIHLLSKTWRVSGIYSRGLAIVGGFTEPFFTNAVGMTLEGAPREKLIVSATAGYSKGDVGLGARANDYSGRESSLRFEVPVRRRQLWLFANYFYYGYSFNDPVRVPVELGRGVNRHGVRGGLTLKVPFLVERTPSAPR